MSSRIFILAFATILAIAFAQKARCGSICKFRFCRADGSDTVFDKVGPRILLRDPNVATNPFICHREGTGRIKVNKAGKAMVYSAAQLGVSPEPFIPIASFRNKPKFPKTYFGIRPINKFPKIKGEKGIFRTKSGGKFELASDDLCVKLPITSYKNVRTGKTINTNADEDCISFRTVVPEILIEVTWDSSDDIDVNVQEPGPGGEKISFRNKDSKTGGRLILDQNVGRCGEDPDGREQIRWLVTDKPNQGTYKVQLRHYESCNSGPTKINAAIIIRGKLEKLVTVTSNFDDNDIIEEFSFSYP